MRQKSVAPLCTMFMSGACIIILVLGDLSKTLTNPWLQTFISLLLLVTGMILGDLLDRYIRMTYHKHDEENNKTK